MSKGRNTSKYAVEQALLDNDLELPPSRLKRAGMAKLTRNGIPIPQMDEEDAECAARYPYLSDHSKEEVLDMAEMAGIDTRGMAKIDACHALHDNGIINGLGLVNDMNMYLPPSMPGKVVGAVNNDWVCDRPTNVVSDMSCGQKSKGAVGMGAWADKVYASQGECNVKCVDQNGGLVKNAKQQLADLFNNRPVPVPSNGSFMPPPPYAPVQPPVNPFSQVGPLREDGTFGKKCKRSIVNHHVKMRDNKGRFCKSKKAKKVRSKSRSGSRKHRRSMRK
jgi:hypothetical protein